MTAEDRVAHSRRTSDGSGEMRDADQRRRVIDRIVVGLGEEFTVPENQHIVACESTRQGQGEMFVYLIREVHFAGPTDG